MAAHVDSYLIIGAGVFGASTALHLSRRYPKASITVVDRTPFPCPIGASHDMNKVIRGDYADYFHTKLGLRALHVWQEDPIFKPFYHQSGMVSIFPSNSNVAGDMLENFKKSKEHYEAELIDIARCKSMFNGLYATANYEDVEDILWNPLCGWAEAAKALEATIQAAVDNGVQYHAATISKLSIDQEGRCRGAITDDGKAFEVSKVILSAGSGTPKLLADSAPHRPEIRAGKRFTAAGVVSAAIKLTPEQVQKYKEIPVFVLDANKTQGQTMPPTPDGQLKFNRDLPFLHTVQHSESGDEFSVPIVDYNHTQWTSADKIPHSLVEEIDIVIKGIYGPEAAKDLKPHTYRLCWDASTKDENFFITPHTSCSNLFIAAAGSWHGYKYLPIIGEHVLEMLEGNLSDEMKNRWSWDRDLENVPDNHMTAGREYKDLK